MTYSSCPPRTGIMIAANEKRGKNPLWVSYLDQGLSERLGGLAAVGATQFPVCAGMTKQRPISRYMCICIHIYIPYAPHKRRGRNPNKTSENLVHQSLKDKLRVVQFWVFFMLVFRKGTALDFLTKSHGMAKRFLRIFPPKSLIY